MRARKFITVLRAQKSFAFSIGTPHVSTVLLVVELIGISLPNFSRNPSEVRCVIREIPHSFTVHVRLYHTKFVNQMILESQLLHQTVNSLFF